jgi:hypothetical protein
MKYIILVNSCGNKTAINISNISQVVEIGENKINICFINLNQYDTFNISMEYFLNLINGLT